MKNHLPWGRDTLLVEIHSKKDQTQRSRASDNFRNSTAGYSILVSSDVSARGVDYPGVTRVIQVGVPGTRDLYIHRVGRTGRAGKAGRGDLVLLPWEIGFLSWQLNDLPLKPFTISETERELAALSADWDSNPTELIAAPREGTAKSRSDKYDRNNRLGGGGRPDRRATAARAMDTTTAARLATLDDSLVTNVLPTLDTLDVRETFASLLGYYITKAHELRTTKDVVVQGLKTWATQAMGLEEEPFVSDNFLRKMGMNDGRTKNRGNRLSEGYRGHSPPSAESSERSGGGAPWDVRGRQSGGRDDRGGRSDSRPSFGASGRDRHSRPSYGDRSSSDRGSSYGSSSADSWEKPDRSSGGGGFSGGRSSGGGDRGRRSY